MPRRKRSTTPSLDSFDDEFEEDSSSSRSNQPPVQRNAANARERARMRVLSSAFCRLKTKLPNIPPDTKLSKLDTLRLATIYIQQLKALLDGEPMQDTLNFSSPQNLTWPFCFQQIQNIRQTPNLLTDDWDHPKYSHEMYNTQMDTLYNGGH